MLRQPIDLPPIISVEFIQISDKTNIPYAPKARKVIEKVKEEEKRVVSEQAPPSAKAKEKPDRIPLPDDQEPLTITINSKGEIYIQEHKVNYQKIVPKLLAIAKNRTDTRIYVRGDKTINYGRVLEVMGTLSGAGFSKVALISEPYKN